MNPRLCASLPDHLANLAFPTRLVLTLPLKCLCPWEPIGEPSSAGRGVAIQRRQKDQVVAQPNDTGIPVARVERGAKERCNVLVQVRFHSKQDLVDRACANLWLGKHEQFAMP